LGSVRRIRLVDPPDAPDEGFCTPGALAKIGFVRGRVSLSLVASPSGDEAI
jgi:hypothetical protein